MKHISDIKHKNKKDIIQLLYKKSNMSKKRIAIELGLSASVLTKLCNELSEEGIIVESAPMQTQKAGRKEIEMRINADHKYCFGITMNHKSTTILLTDMSMKVLDQAAFTTDFNAEEHLNHTISSLRELISTHKLNSDHILGIGISIKGNTDGTYAYYGIWDYKVNVCDYLQDALNIPVVMDNGIRCSAMLEQLHCEDKNFIFIKYMEPGIGGAIVQDGMIGQGETHSVLDFGHLIIRPDGDYCTVCKRKGCLENLISFDHMTAFMKHRFSREQTPILYNLCQGELENLTISTLIDAAEHGCIETNQLFKQCADYFAMAIINTYALLDIRKIIIIGNLFSSNRFITYLKTAIYDYQLTPMFDNIEFHIHENELLSPVILCINHLLY